MRVTFWFSFGSFYAVDSLLVAHYAPATTCRGARNVNATVAVFTLTEQLRPVMWSHTLIL